MEPCLNHFCGERQETALDSRNDESSSPTLTTTTTQKQSGKMAAWLQFSEETKVNLPPYSYSHSPTLPSS